MNSPEIFPRSLSLMSRHNSALLVIDVQEKLLPHIQGHRQLAWNIGRLLQGADILRLPVVASEQYPQGLGPTVPAIGEQLGSVPAKLSFSCGGCPELAGPLRQLADRGIHKMLVCGIETHVCVQQTVLDLMTEGFDVYVAVDAVGSRYSLDRETALGRMDSAGATLTTTEATLFEWCERAGTPEFKQISQLVRQAPPAAPVPADNRPPQDR
jgi:nicotinamidase-related amidase